jgi:hypothetical protein
MEVLLGKACIFKDVSQRSAGPAGEVGLQDYEINCSVITYILLLVVVKELK